MPDSVMFGLTFYGAAVQTAFVLLYLSRPWWRVFVGRALFTKSLALALLLDLAVARHYWPSETLNTVFDWLFACVVAGITLQFVALVVEILHRDRD